MANTTNLLIASILLIAFLLAGCSPREASVFEVPEDAPASVPLE